MKYAATEQATTFLSEQIKGLQTEIEQKEKRAPGLRGRGQHRRPERQRDDGHRPAEPAQQGPDRGPDRALAEGGHLERAEERRPRLRARGHQQPAHPAAARGLRPAQAGIPRRWRSASSRITPSSSGRRSRWSRPASRSRTRPRTWSRGPTRNIQTALNRERSLEAEFNEQKNAAFKMNSSAVLYNGLKVEIQNKKTLLDSLLRRESETGVEARLKGLRTSNIRVVDRARVPVRPSSPNKKRNLILALLLGLGGGVGLAFLFDFLDNSVKTSEDVERYAGLPTLGVVPKFSLEGAEQGLQLRAEAEERQGAGAARGGDEAGRRRRRATGGRRRRDRAPFVAEVEKAEHPGQHRARAALSSRTRGWPRATGPSARRSCCPRPTARSRRSP